MSPGKPQNFDTDYIDLVQLLERALLFLRKYRVAFIIAIVAGIALGSIKYYSSAKMFKSRLILHSSFLTNLEEIEIIRYWNELLKRGEYETLGQTLNCRQELLTGVASIEGSEILKNYSSTNPNGFFVDVRVLNNSILPELQKTIVAGLNSTEYVRQKIIAKKETLKQLIDQGTVERARLDSLKIHLEEMISATEKNTPLLVVSITGINKEITDLNEKLMNYQQDLIFNNGVQVLQSFVPLKTPVSTSLAVMILVGVILTLSITFFVALLNSVRLRLKKRASAND